jgi:hypothetical protein
MIQTNQRFYFDAKKHKTPAKLASNDKGKKRGGGGGGGDITYV